MVKAKYVRGHEEDIGFTLNKVYDVIRYDVYNGSILVTSDSGEDELWYMVYNSRIYFIDCTAEHRNEVIDDILT